MDLTNNLDTLYEALRHADQKLLQAKEYLIEADWQVKDATATRQYIVDRINEVKQQQKEVNSHE